MTKKFQLNDDSSFLKTVYEIKNETNNEKSTDTTNQINNKCTYKASSVENTNYTNKNEILSHLKIHNKDIETNNIKMNSGSKLQMAETEHSSDFEMNNLSLSSIYEDTERTNDKTSLILANSSKPNNDSKTLDESVISKRNSTLNSSFVFPDDDITEITTDVTKNESERFSQDDSFLDDEIFSDEIKVLNTDLKNESMKNVNESKEKLMHKLITGNKQQDEDITEITTDEGAVQNETYEDITEEMPSTEDIILDTPTKVLKVIFGLDKFRTNQKEVITSSLEGNDVFVLMPTGGGKSITYQLPALLDTGITIVVSPLLSLIQDQVKSLLHKNIMALAISSQLTTSEKNLIFEIMQRKPLLCKIYYVTPELIVKSSIFQKILKNVQISRIVIDEAHCVSQWGHDFRPDYKEVGNVIRDLFEDKRVPMIALTATASPKVENDVLNTLRMQNVKIYRMSFNRPNLVYYVHKKTKTIDIDIVSFITTHYPDSCGIIYCTSKKECEMMSERFNDRFGLKTRFYHAGLSKNERNLVQDNWNDGYFKIIVATVAFGMGIDKKNVRFVIHYSLPKSLEGYYQETGRAGRDGLESVCILFYNYCDKKLLEFLIDKGNTTYENKRRQKDEIRNVIQYCENFTDCRRQQVLMHFGENFDPSCCKNTCDNCMKVKGNAKAIDLTDHAKNIYNFIMGNRELTFNAVIDIYKGSKNQKSIEYSKNFYYGKGKEIKRLILERLVKTLLAKGTLVERVKRNSMGFSWNYLATGKRVTDKITIMAEDDIMDAEKIKTAKSEPKKVQNEPAKKSEIKRKRVIIDDEIKVVDVKKKKLNRF